MDKELLIKLKLDRTQATASVKQFGTDAKAVESSLLAAVKGSEDAKTAAVKGAVQERIRDERGRFIALKDMLRSEADAVRGVADAHRQATKETAQGFGGVRQAIGQAHGSLTELVSGFSALRGVASSILTIADAWKKVEESQIAAGKTASEYEKSVRDMAALMGKGSGAQMVPEALNFALKTGMAPQQSAEFYRQFEGAVPAGLQKGFITRQTADELREQSAIMSVRQGGDPKSRGELAGLIAQFGPVRSAQQGLGQLEAIRQGLTEGRGEDPQLTAALLHIGGSMIRQKGGPVATLPELASVLGTMSLSAGPGMADTRTEQLIRGVLGGSKEQQAFKEQTFGITTKDTAAGPRDTLETGLAKMMPKLQEIAKTQDVGAYLSASGIPEEQGRAIVELMENYDVFTQRIQKARGAQAGAPVAAANRDFMTSVAGRTALGQTRRQVSEINRGLSERDYAAMLDLEAAEQDTPESHTAGQQLSDWFRGIRTNPLNIVSISGAQEAGQHRRIQQGALGRLRGQAAEIGVPRADLEKRGLIGGTFSEPEPAEEAKGLAEMIRMRGRDPYQSYDESRVDLSNELNRQREMLPVVPQTTVPAAGVVAGVQPNPRGLPTEFEPEPDERDIVGVLKEIRDKLPEKRTASPVIQNTRPAVQTR